VSDPRLLVIRAYLIVLTNSPGGDSVPCEFVQAYRDWRSPLGPLSRPGRSTERAARGRREREREREREASESVRGEFSLLGSARRGGEPEGQKCPITRVILVCNKPAPRCQLGGDTRATLELQGLRSAAAAAAAAATEEPPSLRTHMLLMEYHLCFSPPRAERRLSRDPRLTWHPLTPPSAKAGSRQHDPYTYV